MDNQSLILNDIPFNTPGDYQSNYEYIINANPAWSYEYFPQPVYPDGYKPAPPFNPVTAGELGIDENGALVGAIRRMLGPAIDLWNGVPVNMPYTGQMSAVSNFAQQLPASDPYSRWRDRSIGNQIQQILDRDAMY